jgi:hypothetical protein
MWANNLGLPRQTLKVRYEAGKASYPCMYAAYPFEHGTWTRENNFKLFQRQLECQRFRNLCRFTAWDDQSPCGP